MSSPCRLDIPKLDELPSTGEPLSLGVPTVDEIIQVGNFGPDIEKKRLLVNVNQDEGLIHLSREDGEDLLVDTYRDQDGGPVRTARDPERIRVISQPILAILLHRIERGEWLTDNSVEVEDTGGMHKFVRIMANHAETKHNKNLRQLAIKAKLLN